VLIEGKPNNNVEYWNKDYWMILENFLKGFPLSAT
jgi:hypothetical protein